MSHTTQRCLRFGLVLVTILGLAASELSAGESRWYLETKLGQSEFEGTLGFRHAKFFDDSDSAASLAVGYTVNRYLAVEIGYHDLGEHGGFGSPCAENEEICPATALPPGAEHPLALCVEGATDPICGFYPLVATPVTADVTGLSFAVVPRYPFNDRFSVYGKVGVIDWDADVSEAFSGRAVDSFSDRDLLTAVGLQYTFPIGFGVLAEYQQLDFDVSSTSLGASYRF
ncbi:MAG: outer membrane beta-barrel protein [Thermoanaerobaculia bacterium]